MNFHYCVAVVLAIAFLFQVAVARAPDITESHDNKAARSVLIVGLLILDGWLWYMVTDEKAGHILPLIALLLIALAEIAFCVNRLFPTVFRHLPHVGAEHSIHPDH